MNRVFNLWLTWLILSLAIIAILVFALIRIRGRRLGNQEDQTALGNYGAEVNDYLKQGRYDEAVQVAFNALRDTPRDASIYDQIALIYLMRAGKDSAARERWIAEAATYSNKALSREPDGAIIIRDAARTFETAADLSPSNRCFYYGRATELSDHLKRVLGKDYITIGGETYVVDPSRKGFVAYGQTFRVEPLLAENEKLLERLKTKTAQAGCLSDRSN